MTNEERDTQPKAFLACAGYGVDQQYSHLSNLRQARYRETVHDAASYLYSKIATMYLHKREYIEEHTDVLLVNADGSISHSGDIYEQYKKRIIDIAYQLYDNQSPVDNSNIIDLNEEWEPRYYFVSNYPVSLSKTRILEENALIQNVVDRYVKSKSKSKSLKTTSSMGSKVCVIDQKGFIRTISGDKIAQEVLMSKIRQQVPGYVAPVASEMQYNLDDLTFLVVHWNDRNKKGIEYVYCSSINDIASYVDDLKLRYPNQASCCNTRRIVLHLDILIANQNGQFKKQKFFPGLRDILNKRIYEIAESTIINNLKTQIL